MNADIGDDDFFVKLTTRAYENCIISYGSEESRINNVLIQA